MIEHYKMSIVGFGEVFQALVLQEWHFLSVLFSTVT